MLNIVTRKVWGAVEPEAPLWELMTPAYHIFLAYTAHESCTGHDCHAFLYREQYKHINYKKQLDISYNYMIDLNGNIYEGRGLEARPCLPMKYKYLEKNSLYIVFIGGFEDVPPPDEMFQAREDFLAYLAKNKLIFDKYKTIVI